MYEVCKYVCMYACMYDFGEIYMYKNEIGLAVALVMTSRKVSRLRTGINKSIKLFYTLKDMSSLFKVIVSLYECYNV